VYQPLWKANSEAADRSRPRAANVLRLDEKWADGAEPLQVQVPSGVPSFSKRLSFSGGLVAGRPVGRRLKGGAHFGEATVTPAECTSGIRLGVSDFLTGCFQIRNLGCCGSARKNAGSREQGARPSFLNPASCKNPLSRCRGCNVRLAACVHCTLHRAG
jgi:hypothetical protein